MASETTHNRSASLTRFFTLAQMQKEKVNRLRQGERPNSMCDVDEANTTASRRTSGTMDGMDLSLFETGRTSVTHNAAELDPPDLNPHPPRKISQHLSCDSSHDLETSGSHSSATGPSTSEPTFCQFPDSNSTTARMPLTPPPHRLEKILSVPVEEDNITSNNNNNNNNNENNNLAKETKNNTGSNMSNDDDNETNMPPPPPPSPSLTVAKPKRRPSNTTWSGEGTPKRTTTPATPATTPVQSRTTRHRERSDDSNVPSPNRLSRRISLLRTAVRSVGASSMSTSRHSAPHQVSIFVTSFNMGHASLDMNDFHTWLPNNEQYDIVVIGTQECSDKLSQQSRKEWRVGRKRFAQSLAFAGSSSPDGPPRRKSMVSKHPFSSAVQMHFGVKYHKVASARLVDMRLLVLAHHRVYAHVCEVEKGHKATGMRGMWGNKGGLMVKIKVRDTSLCFLSCHLTAHDGEKQVRSRNHDVFEILKASSKSAKRRLDVWYQCDHTFVLGDLNYRINLNIDNNTTNNNNNSPNGNCSQIPTTPQVHNSYNHEADDSDENSSNHQRHFTVNPTSSTTPIQDNLQPSTMNNNNNNNNNHNILNSHSASEIVGINEQQYVVVTPQRSFSGRHLLVHNSANTNTHTNANHSPNNPRRASFRNGRFSASSVTQRASTTFVGQDDKPMCSSVINLAQAGKLDELYRSDQLRREMEAGNVLVGFKESPPNFLPTFKVTRVPGFNYNQTRVPSYCDRILYTSFPGAEKLINQTGFGALPDVSCSDHKPVFSTFSLNLRGAFRPPSMHVLGWAKHLKLRFVYVKASQLPNIHTVMVPNPKLRFNGPTLGKEKIVSGAVVDVKESESMWNKIPDIPLRVNHRKLLSNSSIVLSVWDREGKQKRHRTLLGQGVLNLNPWVELVTTEGVVALEFEVPLVRHGRQGGSLSGKMQLVTDMAPSFSFVRR